MTERRLPIEDGDRQWVAIAFHNNGSLFHAKYHFRKKDGTWSDQIRQVWSGDANIPEHVIIAAMEDAISYKKEHILRLTDEIVSLKEALAKREKQPPMTVGEYLDAVGDSDVLLSRGGE